MDDFTENNAQDTPNTSLVIVNNRVMLPKTRAVALESKRFHALLRRTVPSVAPELIEALKAKQERPSRLSRLGFSIGLAVVFLLVFLFWPRNTPLLDTTLTYRVATLTDHKVDNGYRALLKECDALMEKGEYKACAALLKEPAEAILKDAALFRANARLLSMYLDCMQKNSYVEAGDRVIEGALLCQKAQVYSDSPEWRVYELLFSWARVKSICDRLRGGDLSLLKTKAEQAKLGSILAKLDKKAYGTNGTLAQHPAAEVFQKTLDKLRCEILIARWLVEGYPGYPDDFGDPGVSFREDAYAIAKKHDDDIAFLNMRREIANRILNGDRTIFNYYYFDGHKYYDATHLTDVIRDINDHIKSCQDTQGVAR